MPARKDLPASFVLGTATASTQIEGGCTTSDWWAFAHERGGDVPDVACDHWNRVREDTELQVRLGMRGYRMSVEWARIEPAEGRFDDGALEHYREEVALLRASGIEPMVTLHHFSFPMWLAQRGGATARDFPERFARFTERVVRALADHVSLWVTINEPNVLVAQGYLLGTWPPGRADPRQLPHAVSGVRRAHVASYRAIHRVQPRARVGIAHHIRVATPASRRLADRAAAHTLDLVFNRPFFDLPQDWIGVNYYSRDVVRFARENAKELFTQRSVMPGAELTDLGWEIWPEGLGMVLRSVARKKLPIWITENGLADAADTRRAKFIALHLREVARAIDEGIDVRGYLHWSLLDNFEWAEGYPPRFGLYAVDYPTQRRTLRKSGELYAEIARTHELAF